MTSNERNRISAAEAFKGTALHSEFANAPFGFVDIGARGGAHDVVFPIADITSVVGFEPDKEECKRLLSLNEARNPWVEFNLEPIGLFNHSGKHTLHLLQASTNHSLFPPNQDFVERYKMRQFEKTGETSVETEPLDSVFVRKYGEDKNFGEFLKVDTQGSEFEILKGAEKVLSENTVAIVCEVSFFEIYQGQKLFSDVETYLRSLGFAFYGFDSSLHTRSCKHLDKRSKTTRERTMYADAVFFKDPLTGGNATNSTRQNRSLFLSTLILGYFDFALELNKAAVMDLSQSDENRLETLVKTLSEFPIENSIEHLQHACDAVEKDPENANILIGHFVDQRRKYCDYDDVVNVSQHIKNRV